MRKSLLVLAALIVFVTASTPVFAQSEAYSIADFVAAKDKWPQRLGLPLRLEGRYTVFSPTQMRFAGCDVRFQLPKSVTRPRGDSNNVEVSGHLEKKGGEYVFIVQDLRSRPTDLETFNRKRALIDSSRPEEFYELAEWARERGKFYEEEELVRAAKSLFESGLAREFELLGKKDADGMRSLASKAAKFGVSDRIRLQYLHEANRTAFEVTQQQPQPDFGTLLQTISRELPGSGDPLPPDKAGLRRDYAQAPRLAYRVADSRTRRYFDRIFFSEVVQARIEQDAAADGSNGYEIAARIEKQLPERDDLARAYRDRELTYLDSRIAEMTRAQLFDLSSRYDNRGQSEKAADVKRRWLQARERQIDPENPQSLMELGEEYLNILQDKRGAARLFRLAYQANPRLTTVSDWLRDHGYELRDGRWSLPGDAEQHEQSELAAAIHEGRVQAGMNGEQVRAALGGAPSSVVRMASAGQISEIWLYEELRISVQLTRRSHDRELNVRRVTDAP